MTEGTEDEEEDLADARVGLGLHCLWCPTLRRRAGLREGLWRDVGRRHGVHCRHRRGGRRCLACVPVRHMVGEDAARLPPPPHRAAVTSDGPGRKALPGPSAERADMTPQSSHNDVLAGRVQSCAGFPTLPTPLRVSWGTLRAIESVENPAQGRIECGG